MGIKLYLIFKGIKRIIVQAFFRDINKLALRVDHLCILASIVYAGGLIFFPETISMIVYGKISNEINTYFLLIAVIVSISSLTTTAGTKILFINKDVLYFLCYCSSALVLITFNY